ncbi:MAG: hypothetical protein HY671_15230 [Chloroflexi bacterium]|nr:hypothetical protein [Chloroflexota bacterium]
MVSKQAENDALIQGFESREAGVTELVELYARVEATYVIASQAAVMPDAGSTSNSTNPE